MMKKTNEKETIKKNKKFWEYYIIIFLPIYAITTVGFMILLILVLLPTLNVIGMIFAIIIATFFIVSYIVVIVINIVGQNELRNFIEKKCV